MAGFALTIFGTGFGDAALADLALGIASCSAWAVFVGRAGAGGAATEFGRRIADLPCGAIAVFATGSDAGSPGGIAFFPRRAIGVGVTASGGGSNTDLASRIADGALGVFAVAVVLAGSGRGIATGAFAHIADLLAWTIAVGAATVHTYP